MNTNDIPKAHPELLDALHRQDEQARQMTLSEGFTEKVIKKAHSPFSHEEGSLDDRNQRAAEHEVINQKTASRKPLYWGIGIAAAIALVAGVLLLGNDTEEPRQTIAQQTTPMMQTTSEEEMETGVPVETTAPPEREVSTIVKTKQHPSSELLAEATPQIAEEEGKEEPQGRIVGQTIVPTSADLGSMVRFAGSDAVGNLVFLTNHTDGKRLTERLLIHADSASQSWQEKHQRMAHYKQEEARIMKLKNMAFGMGCEPSQANEWVLYYDTVAHTLVYKKAQKNIWQATRKAVYKEQNTGNENKTSWVLRTHPKKCRGIKVKKCSIPITYEQAQGLKAMWMEAVDCAKNEKAFLLGDATYEFPLGELRVTAPDVTNPFITFTNELTEAVLTHNVISKDSLLAESTLEKCLSNMKNAMKPIVYHYDSLIIVVNKQQLPDSLCKQIRYRFKQYYHQQRLIVDSQRNWSAYGAKFYSGYDKNCPIIELTTVPDTLSDAFISQHPALRQSLRHVTGIVLNEFDEPLPDAWVGIYAEGAGAPTESDGRFSFWLPQSYEKLYVECTGYQGVSDILITDALTISMKPLSILKDVKVNPEESKKDERIIKAKSTEP